MSRITDSPRLRNVGKASLFVRCTSPAVGLANPPKLSYRACLLYGNNDRIPLALNKLINWHFDLVTCVLVLLNLAMK